PSAGNAPVVFRRTNRRRRKLKNAMTCRTRLPRRKAFGIRDSVEVVPNRKYRGIECVPFFGEHIKSPHRVTNDRKAGGPVRTDRLLNLICQESGRSLQFSAKRMSSQGLRSRL